MDKRYLALFYGLTSSAMSSALRLVNRKSAETKVYGSVEGGKTMGDTHERSQEIILLIHP